MLRPQISDVFSRFVRQAPVAPPALLAYTPPPTLTPTPPPDPTVCRTLSISVSPAGGGTWEQSPPPNCDTDKYNNNTVVTLTALPASGYQFGSWSGGASGNNAVVMLTMNENKSVTATFSRFCYELAMVVAPTNAGTINPSPAANCGVNKYTEGTVVTVTTLPGVGYQFNNWSDDASGTNLSATVTMDSNKRVTANYSLRCYTLTTAAVPAAGGTINPDPGPDCVGNSYTHGSRCCCLTLQPAVICLLTGAVTWAAPRPRCW
ncbi:MAG: InlB B-repeat-containing protein [Chloroflexi bacterium]|nr:InlB B-repeat-containing protein [Chloroflexota bacterium]